jgi:amino acid adenylation domain-containing protein/non-ribosomal peptide synthase protein (TIGR01720 family)
MSDKPAAGTAEALQQHASAKRQALLQKILRERSTPVQDRIARRSTSGPAPLSFAQQRLWVMDRLEPGSPAYNMSYALRLRGSLDTAALRASLDALVRRHETLRTVFEERGGAPVQVVHTPSPAALLTLDLRGLPVGERQREADRVAHAEALLPFDLERGPLLRSTLLRLADEEHVLLFTLHHIVSDAWSMDLLVREVSTLHAALSSGASPELAELEIQYADFAVWQRDRLSGEVLERQLSYWRDRLTGAPPLLEIPTDRPRGAGQSPRAGSHAFTLSPGVSRGLRALSQREGATLFMTVLAGWQALLARYAGQEDVVVGTPIAGRNRRETEGLIGFFVNMLAMRAEPRGELAWRALLAQVRETALGAYTHQDLPFERLVEELGAERSLTHNPVFQVSFSLNKSAAGERRLELGPLELESFGRDRRIAKFDLDLAMADADDALLGVVVYREALFDADTVARMAGHLEILLEAMSADPERRLLEVSLLRGAERAQVLEAWNDTAAELPRACVHEQFAEQAARAPDAVAIVSGDASLTYAELERRANRLAHVLRPRGVGPESRVGMVLERGVHAVLAMLGILKAGGAYVPLAPSNPAERLREVFADAGVSLVLTDTAAAAQLPAEVESLWLDDAATADALAALPETAPQVASHPGQLAYVIYTSGSTGRPKGVAVAHESVVRLVRSTSYVPFGPEERIAHASNLAFDAATFEIWGALLNGGSLAVIEREVTLSPADFAAALRERQVSALFLTTALFNRIAADEPQAFAGLRHLLFGGEAVDPQSVRRVLETGAPGRLLHVYGPTETTTYASWQHVRGVEAGAATVPIGGPLGNTTLYVLDAGGEPLPAGVPGELYIGGLGVARGYLGQAAMTAERFVPDAFGASGARLYRTGDRVRWTAAGEIEYLGRMDAQVKIRGFRIEPGEVEAVLSGLAEVGEAFVMVREDAPGQKRLAAYLVPAEGAELSTGDLRTRLAARLPDYMVPSAFVVLERLPLNANGKVDRRALPAPEQGAEAGYVAPRTPTEELLAGIWAAVLRLERVGAEDGFFELGGHSLLATQVVSRARQVFGVEVPLRALFEAPTVAGLAVRIEALRGDGSGPAAPPMERVSRAEALPLSFAQQRLWVVDRLEPGSAAYNMPSALRLRGPLHAPALRAGIAELVRRHEALRTTFAERGGAPVQVVHPPAPLPLPLIDLAGLPDGSREPRAERLAALEARRPFDLARGPLLRATLVRLDDEDHVLLLTLHHVVSDGWSMGVLVREVFALYDAFSRGAPSPLPELPVQYADFAVWQRRWLSGETLERQLAWWSERLAGAPPLLELPTDRPRPALPRHRGAACSLHVDAALAGELRALGRREGATLFMTLLAGFAVVLGRWAGQEDVVVGTPIAGRTRRETEGLIGFFLNTLALRTDLSGDPGFRELLGRVREATLGAYAHQDLPFERILEELQPARSLSHSPLFQVMLNLLNLQEEGRSELQGLALEGFGEREPMSKFDMTLYVGEGEEGIRLNLVYDADLFEAARMAELLAQLQALLAQAAADPDRALASYTLRTPAALAVLPDPAIPLAGAWHGPVHALFAAQARRAPERTALRGAGETWTYAELEARSSQLAHWLLARGLARGEAVAVYADRGAALVWAMLGVLGAGGAFVVLDPAYPPARLARQLAAARPRVLLRAESAGALPAEVEAWLAGAGAAVLELPSLAAARRTDFLGEMAATAPEVDVGPEDVAYVAFTSGTTGEPKGIVGTHRPLSHFVAWQRETFGLGEDDRFALLSGLAHDPLLRDVFTPLSLGAALCIPDAREMGTPGYLARWLAEEAVGVVHLTPAMGQLLREGGGGGLPALRHAFWGGDKVRARDVAALRERAPAAESVVFYGATETPQAVSYFPVPRPWRGPEVLPVGRGIAAAQLLVLRPGGGLAGVGEVGEICVRTPHLARGYLHDEAGTRERFVASPFSGAPGDRMYRTGDLGRYRPDGAVQILGRADAQVKVRGFRVEPGEVEAALREHPGVREAVVVPWAEAGREARLVGYVVAEEGEGMSAEELREHARGRLPEYMVPGAFVVLDALPLTPNGKVDRRALPAPEAAQEAEYEAPRTATEEVLSGMWAEVLRRDRVGATDGFFALGGHSLLAMRLVSRLREAFGVEVPLRALFEAPTVRELAARVEALRGAGVAPAPPIVRVPRDGPLPLSFAQQRLWVVDQLEPGSAAYNLPYTLRLRGALDTGALRAGLDALARRHETLRTTFSGDGAAPVQVVHPPAPVALVEHDLRGLPEAEREAGAERLAAEEAMRPFDLGAGPLLRCTLLRLADDDHVLCLVLHHIVSDGWSRGVLVREISALYGAFARGEEPALPELPVQYADFAVWQRRWLAGDTLEAQVGFWKERLAGAPPLLEIPTDRPRAPGLSPRAASHRLVLPEGLARSLRELSRREGATLFMTLLAGWQALLARCAGQDDVVVGSPVAGRTRHEVEGLIGFFVNTLALRADLGGDPTWSGLLGRVREATLGAYDHQDLPFERLVDELAVERSLTHSPVFQTVFTLVQGAGDDERLELGELELASFGSGERVAKFDLELVLRDGGDSLDGVLVYRPALFDAATIAQMAGHLEAVLASMAAAPGRHLSETSLLRAGERAELLAGSRAEPVDHPPACVHELFAAQAARTPELTAVADGGGALSYSELERRSSRLANRLRALGVGPEVRVGVCLERGVEMVLAVLGVLKAGGAYVPLDPAYPAERLAYTLSDSGASLLVSRGRLPETLAAFGGPVLCLDADREAIAAEPEDAPESGVGVRNAAYVVYTSGSTGRPKGVVVEHASLANTLLGTREAFGLAAGEVMPVLASYAFDIWGFEVFAPLLSGGQARLLPRETVRDVERLVEELAAADALHAVPVLMREVVARVQAGPGTLPRIRRVFVGGDAVPPDLLEQMPRVFPAARLWVLYGPTEASILGASSRLRAEGGYGWQVVGRALPGVTLHVCGAGGALLPAGMPGELWIGGAGVARGYLGREELTAERFVPDPFAAEGGARLYRTGDRVRRRPDGELEFLGRVDAQVKIRGFRIEPGEIEAALLEQEGVHEAVVAVREDAPGQKRLVAYVVARQGVEIDTQELRARLAERLPEHMVPGSLVTLEELPLNANGKVDRRALPAPERGGGAEGYVAPRTEVEEILCAVWAGVLRTGRVGVEDNFFELGGDSILSIQLVSRARRRGLRLTPRQVFERPTVAGLAEVAEWAELEADGAPQGPVTGEAPLSPVQRRFFDTPQPARHHYNQALLLRSRDALDAGLLARAAAALEAHHDALRLRFRREDDGHWTQSHAGPSAHGPLAVLDLSALPEDGRGDAVEAAAAQVQRSLELERGPLLRMAWFQLGGGEPGRLLAVAHHLGVDGVSWRVLLEDLETAYTQLSRGDAVELPAKTTSWKAWAERLAGHARSGALADEAAFWTGQAAREVAPLPADDPRAENTLARRRGVAVRLTQDETEALLREVPAAYRTQVDEVLLAALAGALRRWTGEGRLRVELEGHGREEDAVGGVDLSRTVGWFTSVYPVVLELPGGDDAGAAIKAVKEQLRAVPHRGIGYGLLRWLGGGETAAELAGAPAAEVGFNYLGQFDQAVSGEAFFGFAPESAGPSMDRRGPRPYLLEVGGSVRAGRLELQVAYAEGVHRRETVERLAEGYAEELRRLIAHCRSADAGGYTPGDFPLAGLDQASLDALLGRGRGVEDVYPLSPLQEGMLFHASLSPGSGVYVGQFGFVLEGALDPQALERAWRGVVARHEALRAGFAWEDLPRPVQVVRREVELPFCIEDWRGLDGPEQQARLSRYLEADRAAGFRLERAPLMRLAMFRLGDDEHQLVWTHHHLVLDGWSLALIFRDVLAAYAAHARGAAPPAARAHRYRDYVAWLERQDRPRAERFWRGVLAGFGAPTPLPAARQLRGGTGEDEERGQGAAGRLLSEERTRVLQEQARAWGVTMSTLVQGAWGLLLARYAGVGDVVFGATASGRPAELPGVEETVGLFINTLPVRVRLDEDRELRSWLAELQAQQVEAREFEYAPLAEVQRWSDVPPGEALFESLVVFENYPVDQAMGEQAGGLGGLRVRRNLGHTQTNYPLLLSAHAGARLKAEIRYGRARVEAETAERMAGHLETVLEAMASRPRQLLAEVSLLRGDEREHLLRAWNGADTGYAGELCIHELVHAQVLRSPDAPALRFGEHVVSYAELFGHACRLANRLRREGVGPEVRVAISMDPALEMVVSVLGVLLAGGAYLPLDPELPAERRGYVLRDAAPLLLLTQAALADRLEDWGVPLLRVDAEAADISRESDQPPATGVHPDNLAYVIYTSGSTGRPKGVLCEHRGVGNTFLELGRVYGAGPGERNLAYAPLFFDASVADIFTALCSGAELVLARRDEMLPGEELLRTLREQRITHLKIMPSALAVTPVEPLPELRVIVTGGETLAGELVKRWSAEGRRFFNGYGATEAGIRMTSSPYSWEGGDPPIGRAVANTQLYVLDARLEPVPVGVAGELYIGGVGVMRGYLGRPDLTAERFVPDPHRGVAGARLYRTGDVGRRRPDGEIDFLGRTDHQVKVRGYRVELGEIEAVLRTHEQVREAVVLLREDAPGQQRLVAYATGEAGAELTAAELRAHVAAQVPQYMVPGAYVVLARLPVTSNGKVDRRALPAPERASENEYVEPRTEVEELLAQVFAEVLHLERVGATDGFFELGGHSLLATQVVARLRRMLGIRMPLRALFEQPTVEALAGIVEDLLIGDLDDDQMAEHLEELEPEQDPDAETAGVR